MTTLLKIVALMLLTVAVVKGQTVPSVQSSTDISTCVSGGSYTYNVTNNAKQLNGQEAVGQSSVEACKVACFQNTSCTGFDFDTSLNKCFLSGPWSTGSLITSGVTNVDHYTITRIAGSTGSCLDCTPRWSGAFPNTNTYGGKASSAQTLVDCQMACVADPTCSGIDWDPNNPNLQKCWLSPPSAIRRDGASPGVDHYDLTYRPSAQCQQGCIWFALNGAAMGYDSNGFVYPTTNTDDAAIFTETNCLITGVSRANLTGITDTCVSYQLADRPGYYLRNYNGRLRIDKLDIVSPDRFNEDVSFLKLNMSNGNFAFSPVLFRDMYITASLTIGSSMDLFYCYRSAISDLTVVAGSCPYYWSRVNNARAAGATYSTGNCRSRYIYPGLVGVSQSSSSWYASCYYLTDSQTYVRLVPDIGYTHYDYWMNVPQRCQRGCVYSWSPPATSGRYFYTLYQFMADHGQACAKACVMAYRDQCVAVMFTITGAPALCTLLTDSNPNGNYSYGYYNGYWMLNPIYTDCGKCVSSVGFLYDLTDTAAINVGPITGSGQCLTICLNRRKCYGYETRNGTCYITTFKNVTYASVTGTRHTQVYRSPCGNGCVHEWDFYVDSKMESGASVIAAPAMAMTETLCRKACIDNPACTGIDWYQNTMNCTLGLNYPSVNYKTPSTMGYNHYELQRNVVCD